MSEELNKAIAAYINYINDLDAYVGPKCIVGYRYINDTNCRLKTGYTKCYILGIHATYGRKILHNGRKLERSMVFNKTVLDIPMSLFRIELDEQPIHTIQDIT